MRSSEAPNAPRRHDALLSTAIGACAVIAAGILALAFLQLGPISSHMAVHIGLMNIVAPCFAIALAWQYENRLADAGGKALWLATLLQMALLWGSHSPPIHQVAHSSTTALVVLHAALFCSAVTFWTSLVVSPSRWQAMLVLLLSGKLACLLGALLIFSPRVLLAAAPTHDHHPVSHSANLADQHLAGLLMVAACPLSYVLAAIVLAARTMASLGKVPAPAFRALR